MNIVAQQHTLHSTGEGLIKSTSNYIFKIENGSISESTIQIESHERPFKVISVDGVGVSNWNVTSVNSTHTLKINYTHGMEMAYTLKILTELEMNSTSCTVTLPSFSCIDRSISREKGFLGIFTRTNVELKEETKKFLSSIDVSELPNTMVMEAGKPILFAYQFLEVGN